MDKIWELQISSSSEIRQIVARLQYELLEANKQGKTLVVELWKERHDFQAEHLKQQREQQPLQVG